MRTILLGLTAVLLAWAPPALAEDDDMDDLLGGDEDSGDDLFGEDEDSVKSERAALEAGELGDTVGARNEELLAQLEAQREKRLIKTIQRKTFVKMYRFEATPHVAFVANDPFLNRYIVGAGVAYNVTEIFALEGDFSFSPDLGTADWKPLTTQLVEKNHVSPDISKLTYFGSASFMFSPIYGKVAVLGRDIVNFDIFGTFGMGATRTADDLEALQAQGEPRAVATQYQVHPTTNFGGGARIIFNESLAMRIEGKSLVYIETVNATTLEMKNNFVLQAAASFFFPRMKT